MSLIIEAADLFAGSGGTSTGLIQAVKALGGVVNLVAVNHWPVAVATHRANHGGHAHYCMDLSAAEPEEMVPGRKLDLLVASPECVFFSRARGGKPVNDQRRSGADWVLRWLERLDVTCLLIENVEEFMGWGDVDPATGRPIKLKNGQKFLEWLEKIRALGYRLDHKILNAADYGDVTTRRRFFLIARKDGRPIRWPTPTHCKGGKTDVFGTLAPWRAAREIIDWSDLGPSLFERKAPLSPKTRLRIARGASMFWGPLAPLYIRLLDLAPEDERKFIGKCRGGIAEAFTAASTENAVPKAVSDPLGTLTTIPGRYVATPTAEPFVFGNRNNAVPVGPDQPIPGLTTATGGGVYLAAPGSDPVVIGQQSDSAARTVRLPIMAVTTGGVIRVATPTMDPVLLSRNGHNDPSGRVRSADEALATVTGSGSGTDYLATAQAEPFLDLYYGTGVADSVNEPVSTIPTKPRHALVSPILVQAAQTHQAGPGVRPVDDPTYTLTTDARLGVATPIASVITPGFAEREGQHPRVHDLAAPLPAVAATGHLHLATATVEIPTELAGVDPRRLVLIDGVLHKLDIRFRMLTNAELAAAMGFPADYVFTGTKSDVTKQIGNAVCVSLATALVAAILDPEETLAREQAG